MSDVTEPAGSATAAKDTVYTKSGYYSTCDRCGFRFETAELTKQRGILVCPVCYDED